MLINSRMRRTPLSVIVNGSLFAAGLDQSGSFGNNFGGGRASSFVQIGTSSWISVENKRSATFAIKSDGTLWVAGSNSYGQLGINNNTDQSSLVQVGSFTNWKQVTSGSRHTIGIRSDGTLWGWGFGVGSGQSVNTSTPIQIGSLNTWAQVESSTYASMAIKTDGTLWAWGSVSSGEFGNNLSVSQSYSSPVQIGLLNNWKQIAIGGANAGFTIAVKTDGTLWASGSNTNGQFGNNTTTARSSFVQIGTLTNWKQVSCGYSYTLAVKTDGTLWACGYNNWGQLGDNSRTQRISFVQIGTSTNWKEVHSAQQRFYNFAIKTDGTLWSWGYNGEGELGLSSTLSKSSPNQVGALNTWKYVSCGYATAFAIR